MPQSDPENVVRELAGDAVNLLVSVGLIDSISGRWPNAVQEAWQERLTRMIHTINIMNEEVQEFASAWDDGD
jgi:hypothetical protein